MVEVYSRILSSVRGHPWMAPNSRDNEVIIRWVPAHNGITGNEKADEYPKVAVEGRTPGDEVSDE